VETKTTVRCIEQGGREDVLGAHVKVVVGSFEEKKVLGRRSIRSSA